jgi:hypothetical protein
VPGLGTIVGAPLEKRGKWICATLGLQDHNNCKSCQN